MKPGPMKIALYVAAALLCGAALAQFLLADPGYVALRFGDTLIEMSGVSFVLAAILAYVLIRLVARMIRARRLWREAQEERRLQRARRSLARGILEMSEGDWAAAETTLTRSAHDAEEPAAHYLVAARAAELQGAHDRRDDLLARALDKAGDRRAPILIMQAELLIKHQKLDAALATLEQLDNCGEQNARGLMLLARIYRQTGQWEKLQALEPRLRSTRGISTSAIDETVAQIYLDRLKAAAAKKDGEELAAAWKAIPKSLTRRPEIVIAYARGAMACGDHASAEAELRVLLEEQWDEAAVLAYGDLETAEPLETLDRAERWLAEHPQDPALLVTCARLAMQSELYGKARSLLETSLALRPRLETYQLLAGLLEQLGERERAYKVLQDALVHAIGRKAKLPPIRARRWQDRRMAERRRS
ncbi:MAG TPA: heme biosynthesis HemY N-terminal domain-containing protein [Steroidobacteraceae bacterium]